MMNSAAELTPDLVGNVLIEQDAKPVPARFQPDDATLVVRAAAGDREAEALIYHRYSRYIAAIASKLCATETDADDLIQDTFVRALERLSALREPASLRYWLGTIAVRIARAKIKRARFFNRIGFSWLVRSPSLAEEAPEHLEAEFAVIDLALRKSSADEQVTWLLVHVLGHTHDEAANLVSVSVATVKRRLAKVQRIIESLDTEVV